jgi:hypothetical protein
VAWCGLREKVAMATPTTCPVAQDVFLRFDQHTTDDVRLVFAKYDTDGGGLTKSSMQVLLRDVGLLSSFDTPEDLSFLSKQLAAADQDGDGKVGFHEFLVYLRTISGPRGGREVDSGGTSTTTFPAPKNAKREEKNSKVSFFLADDEAENFAVSPTPHTPCQTAERTISQRVTATRHRAGFRSKIPPTPKEFKAGRSVLSDSGNEKAKEKTTPGAETKFGFNARADLLFNAVSGQPNENGPVATVSPSTECNTTPVMTPGNCSTTPMTPASGLTAPTRMQRLANTPRTPLALTTRGSVDDANTPMRELTSHFIIDETIEEAFFSQAQTEAESPTASTLKRRVAVDEVDETTVPESPSPVPNFARPSTVHDATGDLLEFVIHLEMENETPRAAGGANDTAAAAAAIEADAAKAAEADAAKAAEAEAIEAAAIEAAAVEAAAIEAAAVEAAAVEGAAATAELAAAEALTFSLEQIHFTLAEAVSVEFASAELASRETAAIKIGEAVDEFETTAAEVRREAKHVPSTSAAAKTCVAIAVTACAFAALLSTHPESLAPMWTRFAMSKQSGVYVFFGKVLERVTRANLLDPTNLHRDSSTHRDALPTCDAPSFVDVLAGSWETYRADAPHSNMNTKATVTSLAPNTIVPFAPGEANVFERRRVW